MLSAEGIADMRRMGPFLQGAWVGSDVRKESTTELAAAGLEWTQVSPRP